MDQFPLASIGLPIFNGAETTAAALDTLVNQDYPNFEIVISDNASTDGTKDICLEYLSDPRVKYYRQERFLPVAENHEFVLEQARGKYFAWAGCDDTRTLGWLSATIDILESDTHYVAVTCPDIVETYRNKKGIFYSIVASTTKERVARFFEHRWQSRGLAYAVFRRDILKSYFDEFGGTEFFAQDWAFILFALKYGNIGRVNNQLVTLGGKGISHHPDARRIATRSYIEHIVPFHYLNKVVWRMFSDLTLKDRLSILRMLIAINFNFLRLAFKRTRRKLHTAIVQRLISTP